MITTHIHVSISNVKPKKGESSSHAFAKCMKVETSMKVPSILERLFARVDWVPMESKLFVSLKIL